MKAIRTAVLNPLSDRKCEWIADALLIIDKKGKIKDFGAFKKLIKKYPKYQLLEHNTLVTMPCFYDLHFHWVQDDVREMPKDNLLKWLEKYTFPTEKKFKNKKYALKRAKEFSQKLLSVGTLGGACYGSIHGHTVEDALDLFIGDFVLGNVLMTMNSPSFLTQTNQEAITLSKKLAKKHKKNYAFTPRFAPTTHPDVMKVGKKLMKQEKCFMQTHLSETKNEIAWVLDLYQNNFEEFSDVKTYTEIYDRCGLLGKRALFGHGIYLSAEERKLLSKTGSVVVHCPTSNAPIKQKGLGSGLFNFKQADRDKLEWVLGSDIGGGPFLSMFDVIESFVSQNLKKKVSGATYVRGLFRSTLKGAQVLGIEKKTGNFTKGKEANFIQVKMPKLKTTSAEKVIEAIIKPYKRKRSKMKTIVSKTYYKGQLVYSGKN